MSVSSSNVFAKVQAKAGTKNKLVEPLKLLAGIRGCRDESCTQTIFSKFTLCFKIMLVWCISTAEATRDLPPLSRRFEFSGAQKKFKTKVLEHILLSSFQNPASEYYSNKNKVRSRLYKKQNTSKKIDISLRGISNHCPFPGGKKKNSGAKRVS